MRNSCVKKEQREADGYYEEFVEKFKPKKMTDDCYTPDVIYDAVRDWAVKEYGLSGARIIRPFWPGGDYQSEDYSGDCVVIDNPPFSILSSICTFYNDHGVKFFSLCAVADAVFDGIGVGELRCVQRDFNV